MALRKKVLTLWIIVFVCQAAMAEIWFDPSAVERNGSDSTVDLGHFERGELLPGVYRVDVYVNERYYGTGNYTFVATKQNGLQPVLTPGMLRAMGVKTEALPVFAQLDEATPLSDLAGYIPGARATLNFEQQRLDISIAQAAMDFQARGTIDPARWDQGIPIVFVGYNMTGARTWQRTIRQTDNTYFLSLQSGVNVGAWRLRNYSVYTGTAGKNEYKSINTYLARDIQALRGQMLLGEAGTPAEIFDSVMFRGAKLSSEDAMLPDSLRGFAPVVRGIAQSNAMVTVRQNGIIIYQTYVTPGAFEIRDLYPTGASGDLEVIIRETDGREHRFIQPFSSALNMLREGNMKYAVVAGKFRSQHRDAREPGFGMGTISYGISNYLTFYGGVLGADNYVAFALGAGVGLGRLGSMAIDVIDAQTKLQGNDKKHGKAYRIQYAKTLTVTNTTVMLAGYRYSAASFYTFQEANEYTGLGPGRRSRFQMTLSQSLGVLGNLYLSAYQQNHWRKNGYDRTVNVGWNGSYRNINYSVMCNLTQNASGGIDRQSMLTLQIPLGGKLKNSRVNAGSTITQTRGTISQAGLSGAILADNNLSYSLRQGYASRGGNVNGSVSANYRGAMGEVSGGYNYDSDSRQVNFGLQGGIFIHSYGLTPAQIPGETMALVRAPGAKDTKIQNNTGVFTDRRGYAVVPYISAYRSNRIAIDPLSLPDNVELESTVREVVPTRGAVVLADFNTRVGSRALFTLTHNDVPIPFGATVKVMGEGNTSIVGDRGQVYLSGLAQQGKLEVDWGSSNKCQAEFVLKSGERAGIYLDNLSCE